VSGNYVKQFERELEWGAANPRQKRHLPRSLVKFDTVNRRKNKIFFGKQIIL
jgi:hypothetical protein